MMYFSVKHFFDFENHHIIGWSTGRKRGYASIAIQNNSNSVLYSELLVANELIFEKEILGVNVLHGIGIRLQVNSGQVKKLFLQKSHNEFLEPLIRPLRLRLEGCEITTLHKNHEYLPDIPRDEFDINSAIELNSNDLNKFITFDTPNLGKILITKHALDQYVDRLIDSTKPNRPLKSLLLRLCNSNLSPISLPESVSKHKNLKYGLEQRECWGHLSSEMHFMIVRDMNGIGNLVTSYVRLPKYR